MNTETISRLERGQTAAPPLSDCSSLQGCMAPER
ncbi:hypothetical protein [Burkholderia gladioli]